MSELYEWVSELMRRKNVQQYLGPMVQNALEKLNSYYGLLLVVEYGICLQGMYKHQLNAHAYRALQNKVYVQFNSNWVSKI